MFPTHGGQQGQEVTKPQVYLLPEGEGPADSSPWRPVSWEGAQSLGSASVSSLRPPVHTEEREAPGLTQVWLPRGPTPKF